MKKGLIAVISLVALAGCGEYYDYYKGGIRYTQDGADCIYYAGETGNHYSADIRSLNGNKKIVYRNTMCADLYARDNFGNAPRADRQILAPAAKPVVTTSCGCNSCGYGMPQPIARRKYVVVSAM